MKARLDSPRMFLPDGWTPIRRVDGSLNPKMRRDTYTAVGTVATFARIPLIYGCSCVYFDNKGRIINNK